MAGIHYTLLVQDESNPRGAVATGNHRTLRVADKRAEKLRRTGLRVFVMPMFDSSTPTSELLRAVSV